MQLRFALGSRSSALAFREVPSAGCHSVETHPALGLLMFAQDLCYYHYVSAASPRGAIFHYHPFLRSMLTASSHLEPLVPSVISQFLKILI